MPVPIIKRIDKCYYDNAMNNGVFESYIRDYDSVIIYKCKDNFYFIEYEIKKSENISLLRNERVISDNTKFKKIKYIPSDLELQFNIKLPTRLYNVLLKNGITNICDLKHKFLTGEVKDFDGISAISIMTIAEILTEIYGVSFDNLANDIVKSVSYNFKRVPTGYAGTVFDLVD